MLVPNYMKNFKCIGGACEDTCCSGWYVEIDKKTYQRYRGCKDKKIKVDLDKYIKRNRKSNNDNNYAKVILNEHNRCPFLNEDNLCNIYINLGENLLSNVCTIYPRIYNRVDNVLEESLTVSCPEAARIVLDNEGIMTFEEIVVNDKSLDKKGNVKINTQRIGNILEENFWNIRVIAIDIIQNRNYSIDERMIILGLLINEIDIAIKNKEEVLVKDIIVNYQRRIEKGVYKEYIKKIQEKPNVKILLILKIQELKLEDKKNISFKEYVDKSAKFIGYYDKIKMDELIGLYEKAYINYEKNFNGKYEYILENYIVNHIFKNLFPNVKSKSIFQEYIIICIYYSIIKFNLIGLFNNEETIKKEEIIRFIQVFSKTIEHDYNYITIIKEALINQKLDNMACMAILIKK